jgi:hypothetical protein
MQFHVAAGIRLNSKFRSQINNSGDCVWTANPMASFGIAAEFSTQKVYLIESISSN